MCIGRGNFGRVMVVVVVDGTGAAFTPRAKTARSAIENCIV